MKTLAQLTVLLLAVVILTLALRQLTFTEYSRDFGSLSPERFRILNERMDRLARAARVAYAALGVADLALIVAAARRRAFLVLGFSCVLALGLASFLLLSLASVGPAMVGFAHDMRAGLMVTRPSRCGVAFGVAAGWAQNRPLRAV